MEYRIEHKYLCNRMDYAILQSRVNAVMQLDPNANEHGTYQIRSLYYDDWYHSKYHENEQGSDLRYKYRMRAYDCKENTLRLEKKSKVNTYIKKESVPLSREQFQLYLAKDIDLAPSGHNLLNEFNLSTALYGMAPAAIIEYDREAYIYQAGNVRVTFDMNLRVSDEMPRFFEKDLLGYPMLYNNQFLLEIKYDEFLPKQIAAIFEMRSLQQTTFSKFYLGMQGLLQARGGIYHELSRYV